MDLIEVVPIPNAGWVTFAPEKKIVPAPSQAEPSVGLRRSSRLQGISPSGNYCDEVYLSNVIAPHKSYHDQILSHKADRETDFSTGLLNCSDPRAYAAKIRHVGDPDNPSYTLNTSHSTHCAPSLHSTFVHLTLNTIQCTLYTVL